VETTEKTEIQVLSFRDLDVPLTRVKIEDDECERFLQTLWMVMILLLVWRDVQ
jgi:hypothetical protein